ncbi:M23 family metallopeptidase [Terrabacter sp. Soil810]|uniref:M23 family metallopeptidase n=1 Tax=Terrabacter sp. Soil810 TaxID=1736418 RepID=UPI0012FCB1ED|nr:M23 family metallopeptidase [Terrabacter sp. Soil810]
MSGRLVPFATMLLLFALLPFLGGSTPQTPTASVVLAAGSPAAVKDAVAAVGQARQEMRGSVVGAPTAALAPVDSAFSAAIGGGLFMFPAISLAPATAQAIAAPIIGRPLFIHPVPGGETSPFGPRIHPLLGRPMFHTGIDLAAACGTPIHAAADGTVIYARVSASWGGRTIIEHTPTLKTAYGHQSKFLVTEGQHVKQGQVIGLSGTTGWSTGCHLHFDVIVNDRYVDPAPYLGFAPSATASVPYAVVPHLVFDQGGRVIRTVEDGDVPIPEATETSSTQTSTGGRPPTSTPTQPTTTQPSTSTGTPTTSRPSTTTSAPSSTTTSSPTSTKPSPTTTTSSPSTTVPPTTSAPSTTTTSDPPPATTSDPPPATTSDPPPATTSDPPAPTSEAPSTTSEAAAPVAADPTPTATATATATEVLKTATEVATAIASATDTSSSEPTASTTTAAEGGA